jgi:hypothetical protein
MDEDFTNRTVMAIVCDNEFDKLAEDERVIQLIDELWVGKLIYDCDGKLANFSFLTYLASSPLKKLAGQSLSLASIFKPGFVLEVDGKEFSY